MHQALKGETVLPGMVQLGIGHTLHRMLGDRIEAFAVVPPAALPGQAHRNIDQEDIGRCGLQQVQVGPGEEADMIFLKYWRGFKHWNVVGSLLKGYRALQHTGRRPSLYLRIRRRNRLSCLRACGNYRRR